MVPGEEGKEAAVASSETPQVLSAMHKCHTAFKILDQPSSASSALAINALYYFLICFPQKII